MGRSPCCEKVGLKKGPWTPEEDQKLLAYIEKHGHGSWRALPAKAGLQRCGKSCRLRWTNYLRPDIKRGKFSLQEEQTIIQLHALLGNRWSAIATHLPKRTDNEIKNYWNTHLKKRLAKMGIDPVTHKPKTDSLGSVEGRAPATDANLSHMAQWESARLEAEARLAGEAKLQLTNSFQPCHVAPARPPLCLDVLKAWQGLRPRPSKCGALLESPTSTLTTLSSENSVPIAALAFANVENSMGYVASSDVGVFGMEEGPWSTGLDGVKAEEEDDQVAPMPNFIDGFTDLLLGNNSHDVRNNDDQSQSGGNSDSNGDENEEENKNYWNNILNLVNSSPSDSAVF